LTSTVIPAAPKGALVRVGVRAKVRVRVRVRVRIRVREG